MKTLRPEACRNHPYVFPRSHAQCWRGLHRTHRPGPERRHPRPPSPLTPRSAPPAACWVLGAPHPANSPCLPSPLRPLPQTEGFLTPNPHPKALVRRVIPPLPQFLKATSWESSWRFLLHIPQAAKSGLTSDSSRSPRSLPLSGLSGSLTCRWQRPPGGLRLSPTPTC